MSRKRKIRNILLVVNSIVLVILIIVAFVIYDKTSKIERIEIEEETIETSITEEVEHKTGYLNVAVFGLDSRKGSLGKGNRSDTILIASLNHETKEVRMVSVYRDTFLEIKDDYYNKANAAYSFYGPEGAIAMINKNMDMNIDKYVAVNFNALVDVIDAIGGMDLELTYEEVVHMNNYCVETSKVTGKSYKKIEPEKAGTYHLNGVQAVSYSRIRQTAGDDAMRTQRQRIVIAKIMEKMQELNLSTINKMIDSVLPQVATNFKMGEILSYAKDFKEYKLGATMGFPNARTPNMLYGIGSTEVAKTLESNVTEVHQFLFDNMDYEASSTVKGIDKTIKNRISSGFYDEPEEVQEEEEKKEEEKEDTKEDKNESSSSDKNSNTNTNTNTNNNNNSNSNTNTSTGDDKISMKEIRLLNHV